MPSRKGKYQPVGVGMTPSKTELGSYIRARRIELDIRQVPLAQKAGLAPAGVSMIEVGTRKYLNDLQLERLAKVLQCDPEELRKRMPIKLIAPPKTELGELIRSRREELSLSHKDLAKRMEITLKQAWSMEARKSPTIRYGSLKPLAKALELEPSVLVPFVGRTNGKESKSELGNLVRNRRRELGMSTRQLADKLDVSEQFISQIELGQCRLSEGDERIAKLAHVLELDATKLEAVRPKRKLKQMPAQMANANPLGGFLAAKRLELHLTQKEVGERIGLSSTVISYIERGKRYPRSSTLERVAKALDCQIPPELISSPK
jgi:transcriptional regulator with XRE-family HTH domain